MDAPLGLGRRHALHAALALVPVLLGAAWAHAGNGWLFSAPGGGWEFPVFWAMTLVAQSLQGDGAYALKFGQSPVRATAAA